jgi:hypothetical protein
MEISEELLTEAIQILNEVVERVDAHSELGWKAWVLKLKLDNYKNAQQEDTT